MYTQKFLLGVVLSVLYMQISAEEQDKVITKAIVKSCPGCSLNRLHEVKAFVYEDVPKYDNVEFVKVPGHTPVLIYLNDADEEIETIKLSTLNREQCNELLTNKGFKVKREEPKVARAAIKSCPGCSLNRLKEVRAFVYDDIPKYENTEFIKISGHKPELIFYDEQDEEIETIQLSDLNREQCNDLLKKRGFTLKAEENEGKTEL